MNLYLVPTTCPACYWRGWLSVYEAPVEHARRLEPDVPWQSIRCSRSGCGTMYDVTAGDVSRARPKDIAA